MTETLLSSSAKEVVIGFDRPFVVIGERINPTGRKALAAEMAAGNFDTVVADAVAQVEAGAQMLDVNAGIPLADEPGILAHTVELVQSIVDVPLSIDSSIVEALEAGLAVYRGKALVNSVTGEDEQMERVLPLVARHGAAVVAITNDETGISEDPDVRFEVARKIVSRAEDHGIPREDVVVDPLVMPIGAMGTAGRQVFRLLGRLRDELGVNTTCGASNVSFGLPNRTGLNAAFLPMAIASGLTSAITSPLHGEMLQAIKAADVMMGNDPHCAAWIARNGDGPATAVAGRRGGRAARRSAAGRMSADALVVFTPSGRRGRVPRGASVLDAARTLGVDLDSVCGGRGICGRCQVTVAEGEHAKHGITCTSAALTPVTETEQAYAADRGLAAGRRLGCTALVAEDVVIDVPPESQVYRQVVRKEADARSIAVDPVVRLYFVEVEEPQLASPRSDLGRLLEALETGMGLARSFRRSSCIAIYSTCSTSRPRLARHGRRPRRVGRHRDLARLPRRGVRHRVRRRLDDRGRPPVRPAHRRRGRVGGRDEPADPLRRGPHEPRLVRHAQRRLGEGAHAGGPRLPREADRRAVPRRGHRADGCPRGDDRRESRHASPPPRNRPDRARRRAVRARVRRRRSGSTPASWACRSTPERARTCCRASPGTSAPTPPA